MGSTAVGLSGHGLQHELIAHELEFVIEEGLLGVGPGRGALEVDRGEILANQVNHSGQGH